MAVRSSRHDRRIVSPDKSLSFSVVTTKDTIGSCKAHELSYIVNGMRKVAVGLWLFGNLIERW